MLVYLKDRSAQTVVGAATLRTCRANFSASPSHSTDTGPTSPRADPATSGIWQGSHWNASFEVTDVTQPQKNPRSASGNQTTDLLLLRCTPDALGQKCIPMVMMAIM